MIMCFFKKKKKEVVETKYHLGDMVSFRYRGDLTHGWVYVIHPQKDGTIIYDIQVGGQCPAILNGFKEEDLHLMKKKEEQ